MIDFLFIIYLIHHSVLYLNTMMVLQDLANRRFIIDITKKNNGSTTNEEQKPYGQSDS